MKKRQSLGRDVMFWKVLNAALELDFKKGHLKWTMSDLARKSQITRSLIYYHFGRSKAGILDLAVQVIGEEVVGATPARLELWQRGQWLESVLAARTALREVPSLGNFYLLHRDRPTEIGRAIRKIEESYYRKLGTFFPELPLSGRRAIFALFFGLVFGPGVDDEAVRLAVDALKGISGLRAFHGVSEASVTARA